MPILKAIKIFIVCNTLSVKKDGFKTCIFVYFDFLILNFTKIRKKLLEYVSSGSNSFKTNKTPPIIRFASDTSTYNNAALFNFLFAALHSLTTIVNQTR